jgi:hypothetical protein
MTIEVEGTLREYGSTISMYSPLLVAYLAWEQEVDCSNNSAPTKNIKG